MVDHWTSETVYWSELQGLHNIPFIISNEKITDHPVILLKSIIPFLLKLGQL
jgi:hypothetical protein